jgi:hypothetical protein
MSEKTTLLGDAETELTQLKRAIAGLSEAQMRPIPEGVSYDDVDAWIEAWRKSQAI